MSCEKDEINEITQKDILLTILSKLNDIDRKLIDIISNENNSSNPSAVKVKRWIETITKK